jgi:hypothetical protein
MTRITSGTLGVDITSTKAGTTTDGSGAEFVLGQCEKGADGTVFMYVQAGAAITQYQAVGIDENFQASPLTKTMADDGWMVGFAQIAASDNDFFWLCMEGSNINVQVAGSCAADVSLYTTSTAGVLDDTSASQTKVQGVTAVAANATTSATNTEVIAKSVHVDLPA